VRRRLLLSVIVILAGGMALPATAVEGWHGSRGQVISGQVLQVIDGDTLAMRDPTDGPYRRGGVVHVRLHGIDAPEYDQTCLDHAGTPIPCGAMATATMVELLGGRTRPCSSGRMHGQCLAASRDVSCTVVDVDRKWGRPVAICRTGSQDLGREMVALGMARAAYGYDYAALGALARFERRGLWSGRFDDPAESRRRH
jgi:endonuclease YncB( thermonuclease family)